MDQKEGRRTNRRKHVSSFGPLEFLRAPPKTGGEGLRGRRLQESAWLFPDEGSFQAVLDPLDCASMEKSGFGSGTDGWTGRTFSYIGISWLLLVTPSLQVTWWSGYLVRQVIIIAL